MRPSLNEIFDIINSIRDNLHDETLSLDEIELLKKLLCKIRVSFCAHAVSEYKRWDSPNIEQLEKLLNGGYNGS